MSLTSKCVVAIGLIVSLMSPVWAQETAGESPEVSSALMTRMKQTLVSVDFKKASMEDVITALSSQADLDMIKSPDVTGLVTAKLTDVPLNEALESILAVHGYGYQTTDTIVQILPLEQLQKQEVHFEQRMYKIAYANIDTMQEAIADILSEDGNMSCNRTSNHLLVYDAEDRIAMIDKFVAEADHETPQILVEARIYDISCEDGLDLGFNWFGGTNTTYDSDTSEATGGQLNPFSRMTFGSNYNNATSGNGTLRFGILHNDLSINMAFSAVKDTVKARLLASPTILVLDNEQASIKIVEEIPYQELTQTTGGGNIGTTNFKEVGVQLTVRPRVTRGDKVRLAIKPEFSVQTGSVDVTNTTNTSTSTSSQPIVDRREAMTQALIESGQTVVIGGLRKSDEVDQVSKVPLISDLPLLGELFKFHSEKTVNSELVVFITPHIIHDLSLTPEQQSQYIQAEEGLRAPAQPDNQSASVADED